MLIVVGWFILASDCGCCVACLFYGVVYCGCLLIVFNILLIALLFFVVVVLVLSFVCFVCLNLV